MKELVEAIAKNDMINANSLLKEALKKKIKNKLDQKKKEVMEPVHVDSFDVKDDHENIHEGFSGLKQKDAEKILKGANFIKIRTKGSHSTYKHEDGRMFILSGDLSPGTHRELMKVVGGKSSMFDKQERNVI